MSLSRTARLACVLLCIGLTGCSTDKESMSVFLAKEMCSCHFLVERNEADCRKDASLALLVGDVTLDASNRSVTAKAKDGSNQATAQFVSKKFGCKIQL